MEKVENNNINFIELLNEIKATIKNSGFPIDYRKSYEIDKIIKPIIEAINKKEGELPEDFKEIEKGIGNKIRTLYYYYFALYEDNLDLLKVLAKQNYDWDDNIRDSIFLLDKNLSSNFSLKHYLFLIKCCRGELFDFYEEINATIPNPKVVHENKKNLIKEMNNIYQKLFLNNTLSTEDKEIFLQRLKEITLELKDYRKEYYSKEEKENAYKQLSQILTVSPFICKKKEPDSFGRTIYKNLLSPYVMETFGVEGVLDLTDSQKQIISQIDCRNKDIIKRTKGFIEEYPNYSRNIRFHKELLDNLSNEEIASLTPIEEKIYEKALNISSCKRVKELKDKGFSFEKYLELINPMFFTSLSDEEILGLSEKDIQRIKNLLINGAHLVQVDKSSLKEEIKRVANNKSLLEIIRKRIF